MMDIFEQKEDSYEIITIQGDFLSEDEKPTLHAIIQGVLSSGRKFIIMDLSKVHYMNSCGLGSLIASLTTIRKASGDIVLLSPSENVKYVLSITRLNQIFLIYQSRDQAIASLP